ncbi:MAG TPA: murein biosynthesis integral membrane protein MurJ [Chloroflexota bacterium]
MTAPDDGSGAPTAPSLAPRAIGIAAVIIMCGNLTTSLLGFVRQAVMSHTFGAHSVQTDAFVAASVVPQIFYDLTIGAAVSAALIPTLSLMLEKEGKEAVARLSGAVLGLAWSILALLVIVLLVAAHPVMALFLQAGGNKHPGELARSVTLVRILVPSLFFLGTSAVFLATLYSLRRFTVSAFATAFFHIGIIAGAVLLARPLGIEGMAVGAVAGAAVQALVQVPALWRAGVRLRVRVALTPEVRGVLRLYAPVALGLLVSVGGQVIDLNFKAQLETGAITSMSIATTLTQFPIGIAVAALSFAILPSLSLSASPAQLDNFKETLTFGLRLVFFLTIPAAIAYLSLGVPIIRLLFQHGHFTAADTTRTASALFGYAPQIPFVGIDQLLIFAFYARKNTRTPMLIGVVGVGIYVASALVLRPTLHVFGLALANTLQNSLHGLILLVLLILSIGTLRGYELAPSIGRTCLAGSAMALTAGLASHVLQSTTSANLAVRFSQVAVPTLSAIVVYVVAAAALRSRELAVLIAIGRRAVT